MFLCSFAIAYFQNTDITKIENIVKSTSVPYVYHNALTAFMAIIAIHQSIRNRRRSVDGRQIWAFVLLVRF